MLAELTHVLWELWELVDVLTRVTAAGDAESEVEVKTLQQTILEIVSLNHPEVLHCLVSHRKLHAKEGKRQKKKQKVTRAKGYYTAT